MPQPNIRALTIRQPWASAIAVGAKRIETRSWQTSWRGTLLIHAGLNRSAIRYPARHHDTWAALQGKLDVDDMPLGAIIAIAELADCVATYDMVGYSGLIKNIGWDELRLGDYSDGRYGLVLSNVRALPEPVPCRGKQGLWKPPVDVLAAVNDQMDAKGPTP